MISSILFFHLVSYFLDYFFFCQMACSLNLWTSRVTSTDYFPLFICSFFFQKPLEEEQESEASPEGEGEEEGDESDLVSPQTFSNTEYKCSIHEKHSIHESHFDKMLWDQYFELLLRVQSPVWKRNGKRKSRGTTPGSDHQGNARGNWKRKQRDFQVQ